MLCILLLFREYEILDLLCVTNTFVLEKRNQNLLNLGFLKTKAPNLYLLVFFHLVDWPSSRYSTFIPSETLLETSSYSKKIHFFKLIFFPKQGRAFH